MNNKIIGIGGTNGAGKDSVGEILAEKFGYLFVSVTELLREEIRNRGLSVERKNLRVVSSEWRAESGLGVLVDKAMAEFEKNPDKYKGIAISSLRNGGEADRIHELGGTMIWIDADIKLRYERIQSANRGREAEDNKTFEEFVQEESDEMTSTGDETTLRGADVKEKSDMTIENGNTTFEELTSQLQEKLKLTRV